jgi:transcription elongation factor Elf1
MRNRSSFEQRERDAARWRKWNEVRPWHLTCPSCEHDGFVNTTLKRLRAANIKCSACGAYLWRNRSTQ